MYLLTVFVIYQSITVKVGYSSLELEQFNTLQECQAASAIVKDAIADTKFDTKIISCTKVK